jgi:hypothetical protein
VTIKTNSPINIKGIKERRKNCWKNIEEKIDDGIIENVLPAAVHGGLD